MAKALPVELLHTATHCTTAGITMKIAFLGLHKQTSNIPSYETRLSQSSRFTFKLRSIKTVLVWCFYSLRGTLLNVVNLRLHLFHIQMKQKNPCLFNPFKAKNKFQQMLMIIFICTFWAEEFNNHEEYSTIKRNKVLRGNGQWKLLK